MGVVIILTDVLIVQRLVVGVKDETRLPEMPDRVSL